MSLETEAMSRPAGTSEDTGKARPRPSRAGGSRVDEAYRRILAMITEGALAGGQRLPSEGEMAARIGVSRPVVRQALTRLQHSGVVKVRWGAGTYVQDASGAAAAHAGPSFGPVRSLNEVRQVYEFRTALEGEAAGLAAERSDADALAAARRALERLAAAPLTGTEAQEADLAFHMAIAAAAGNPFYERVMRSIQRPIEFSISLTRTLLLTYPQDRLLADQAEHAAVLRAIEAGRPAEARQAMRTHLENTCRRLFQGPGD